MGGLGTSSTPGTLVEIQLARSGQLPSRGRDHLERIAVGIPARFGAQLELARRQVLEVELALVVGPGAVAAVKSIKNPIQLARRILEDGRHLLMAGDGALSFARQVGFPVCPPESLIVETAQKRWQDKHGTVGCVALDRTGSLAAGTSTGGVFNKLPGRVGDSPLIGCGTYADDIGGVSCTGHGEAIIRIVMAKTALGLLQAGSDPRKVADEMLKLLEKKTGARAGLIIMDQQGRAGYARNTVRMPVCLISDVAEVVTDS